MQKNLDQFFLKEALKLAKKGMGRVNPNPMVGAVLTKDGKIIGKGFHKEFGLPHAEIEALDACKTSPQGATLYVNLEPCSHFGKTPPCVGAIISAKIKRVVCCTQDPNPKVNGLGKSELQKMGILFDSNMLEDEALVLNEAFFTFHEKKRPLIAIKFAASLDGKIATYTEDAKWITNEKARDYARKLRGEYQAVLVGINTVLRDNTHLGTRIKGIRDSIRIILDSKLQVPLDAQVLRDKNVIIVITEKANQQKLSLLQKKGFEVVIFDQKIEIPGLLRKLWEKEIISILVEGGGQVLGSFMDARVVDKVYVFQAPILIGGEKAVSAIGGTGVKKISDAVKLTKISQKKFDDNWLTIGYPSFTFKPQGLKANYLNQSS